MVGGGSPGSLQLVSLCSSLKQLLNLPLNPPLCVHGVGLILGNLCVIPALGAVCVGVGVGVGGGGGLTLRSW